MRDSGHDNTLEIGENFGERFRGLGGLRRQFPGYFARTYLREHGVALGMLEVGVDPGADPHKVFFETGRLLHNNGCWLRPRRSPPRTMRSENRT